MEKSFYNSEIFGIEEKYISLMSKACAVILAMCPILQHYKGIHYNAGVIAMIAVAPYFAALIFANRQSLNFNVLRPVLPMIVCQIFMVINHGTFVKELGEAGVYVIYLVAIVMGCMDVKSFLRASSCIAFIACAGIMLQYVCFYIFGFHLQMVPTGLLLPSSEQWILNAQTGLANIRGVMGDVYRPSAFFLEPSHAYLYIFPHIILFMFNGKDKKHSLYPAIFLSAGLLLTTSGMGITAVRILWIMYLAMKDDKDGSFSLKNIFRAKSLGKVAVFFVVSEIAIAYVPFLNDSFLRIFVPEHEGGSTAIGGRLTKAIEFLGTMSKDDMLTGVVDHIKRTGFNIPGVINVFYRHGFIGLVLSYSIYIMGLFNTKLPGGVICLGVLGTSLFSIHTHATVYMMYFIILILSEYAPGKRRFLS